MLPPLLWFDWFSPKAFKVTGNNGGGRCRSKKGKGISFENTNEGLIKDPVGCTESILYSPRRLVLKVWEQSASLCSVRITCTGECVLEALVEDHEVSRFSNTTEQSDLCTTHPNRPAWTSLDILFDPVLVFGDRHSKYDSASCRR